MKSHGFLPEDSLLSFGHRKGGNFERHVERRSHGKIDGENVKIMENMWKHMGVGQLKNRRNHRF